MFSGLYDSDRMNVYSFQRGLSGLSVTIKLGHNLPSHTKNNDCCITRKIPLTDGCRDGSLSLPALVVPIIVFWKQGSRLVLT